MYEIYVVKDGDTLDSIAKEYGVMSLELKRRNHISIILQKKVIL